MISCGVFFLCVLTFRWLSCTYSIMYSTSAQGLMAQDFSRRWSDLLFLSLEHIYFKFGSHRVILFWREKLKLSPLLFPGNSDIFKAIFLYRPINFDHQRILTKLILSPNLEEKSLSWKQRDGMQTSFTVSSIISVGSTSM